MVPAGPGAARGEIQYPPQLWSRLIRMVYLRVCFTTPAAFAELIAKRLEELYLENMELKKRVSEQKENQITP